MTTECGLTHCQKECCPLSDLIDIDDYMQSTRFYRVTILLDVKEYACAFCATEEIYFDENGLADIGIFRSIGWAGPFGLCQICYQHYECRLLDMND